MASVGRPSKLNDHLFRKIKELVLEGLNLREISEALEIPYATMRDWEYENYEGFSDRMLAFKHERIIKKAEANIEVLLESEDQRVVADMTKFTLERLNKKNYSSRVEQTGKDGKDLPTPILSLTLKKDVSGDNSTAQDSKTDEED